MKHIVTSSLLAASLVACGHTPDPHPTIIHVPYQGVDPLGSNNADDAAPTPSLWSTRPEALLSMRQAKDVGDLLTVIVEMDDRASLQNSLSRSRGSNEDLNINALFGLPEWANGVLPGGASVSPGIDMSRNSNLSGSGAVNRAEKVTFKLASRVVGIEPNGNLIIEGYQQTQVSNEVRYLTVSGVIRAQDITRTNTVTYDKIADARLSYVSSGETTGSIVRRPAAKLLDKVIPF